MRKDIFLLRDALALGKHVPEIELSFCHSLICSTKIPHHFLSIALRNALPLAIYDPEIELRGWIALVSSFPIPVRRLNIALRDALTLVVHIPEIKLGIRATLISKLTIKPDGDHVVRSGIRRIGSFCYRFCCRQCGPAPYNCDDNELERAVHRSSRLP